MSGTQHDARCRKTGPVARKQSSVPPTFFHAGPVAEKVRRRGPSIIGRDQRNPPVTAAMARPCTRDAELSLIVLPSYLLRRDARSGCPASGQGRSCMLFVGCLFKDVRTLCEIRLPALHIAGRYAIGLLVFSTSSQIGVALATQPRARLLSSHMPSP